MSELPHINGWWGVIVFLLFGPPAYFSRAGAKLPGVLGAGARWWRRRSDGRAANVVTISTQRLEAMIDEKVAAATAALNNRLDEVMDYQAYDAEWHREKRVYMAEQGWELPPPSHLTLTEWRQLRTYQSGGSV